MREKTGDYIVEAGELDPDTVIDYMKDDAKPLPLYYVKVSHKPVPHPTLKWTDGAFREVSARKHTIHIFRKLLRDKRYLETFLLKYARKAQTYVPCMCGHAKHMHEYVKETQTLGKCKICPCQKYTPGEEKLLEAAYERPQRLKENEDYQGLIKLRKLVETLDPKNLFRKPEDRK
jgi:hypothetical protein